MNNKFKRAISSVLAFVMLFSSFVVMNVGNVFAAAPEAGQTYTWNLGTLSDFVAGSTVSSDDGIFEYAATGGGKYHSADYGFAVKPNDTLKVKVAGNATISLKLSIYAPSGSKFTVTNSAGTEIGSVDAHVDTDKTENSYDYVGGADTLTFTYSGSGQGYLGLITVVNAAAAKGEAKSFELWLDDIATDGVIEPGDVEVAGDSTLELIGNGTTKYTVFKSDLTRAGKTVNAYKAGNRPSTASNMTSIPKSGDGTCIVFKPVANGMFNVYFTSTSFINIWDFASEDATTSKQNASETAAESFAVQVEVGHTYVVSSSNKTNSCGFAGFEYAVDEAVNVNVTVDSNAIGNAQISLVDADFGTTKATVTKDTTSVTLLKGHSYVLKSNDGGKKPLVSGATSFKCDGSDIAITIEDVPDTTLTGKITGADEDFDVTSVTSLKFTSMVDSEISYTTTNISADGTYTIDTIKPGEYNTSVVSTKGYQTKDRVSVSTDASKNVNEVYCEPLLKSKYVLPEEMNGSPLTFTGVGENNSTSVVASNGATIVVPVNGKQKVTVAGWYAGTWNINGENEVTATSSSNATNPVTNSYTTDGTETSVTINVTSAPTYFYWITVEDAAKEFVSEISVPGDYDTLTEAVAAINAMSRPDGESGRVTINLTADLQEQVNMTAPYVTLNGNGHTISWYYGQSCTYYSVGTDGLYSETLFRDKYDKTEGSGTLWGGVFIVRGDNFKAVNTTFKNTFNYEVTDKEIEDGAERTDATLGLRTKSQDVAAYAHKERSNAFYIEADNIEAVDCKILSSQDTFGRNGSTVKNYNTYFKNCVIGGNVDYICGEFSALFENCELQWKTYPGDEANNAKIGYIVAPKTSPYVFRNCTVTSDDASVSPVGYYGRTWGAKSNATFINTKTNGYINENGWTEMTKGDLGSAIFKEYKNRSDKSSATAFESSNGVQLTDDDYNAFDDTTVLDDFVPESYNPAVVENIQTVATGDDLIVYGEISEDAVDNNDFAGFTVSTATDLFGQNSITSDTVYGTVEYDGGKISAEDGKYIVAVLLAGGANADSIYIRGINGTDDEVLYKGIATATKTATAVAEDAE